MIEPRSAILPAAFVALLAVGVADAQTTSGALTIDALLDIRHPSKAAWSPDGQRIAFAWERSGTEDVYVVDAKAGEPRALTHHETGLVDGLTWRRDGAAVYFERVGDLWEVARRPARTLG
jgi:dipeptidyl aminopeptidase/acylaminoacyl peptidase